jgi:hypothetical protein
MPGGPQLISLIQDPGGTVHAVWEGLVGAIRDDWNSGQKDEAAGRGAIVLLELVVGPKGADAASKAGAVGGAGRFSLSAVTGLSRCGQHAGTAGGCSDE